jgi:hypothetical protein
MPRLVFTAVLAGLIVASGVITGSAWHPLPAGIAHRFAFAPIDLRTGSWHRLATSAFLTGGPAAFWKVLALIAIACGAYEWRRGTRATAVGCVFLHLLTLLALSLAILAGATEGWSWAASLVDAYDVGPSVGCYGCFGMLLGDLGARGRALLIGGFVLVTSINLVLHLHAADVVELGSDAEHALAIVLGWLLRPRAPLVEPASAAA